MFSRATALLGLILLCTQPATAAIPCQWEAMIGPSIGLTDDSTTQVMLGFNFPFQGMSYNSAWVSSNGFVAFGMDPGSGCCDADIAAFLGGPPRIAIAWHDMNPGSGGQVTFQSFGRYAAVTWNMVPEFGSVNFHNMQMLLYDTGEIVLSYDILEPVPTDHRHHGLVGITPGGGAPDPGEIDFSAGLPYASGATGTIYEFFARGPNGTSSSTPDPDPYDLSSSIIRFTPSPMGGFTATDCGGGGGGGCSMGGGSCGDCDGSGGAANILDALTAAQLGAGISSPTPQQSLCCDVNSSMTVEILDALLIAQAAAGIPVLLTCP